MSRTLLTGTILRSGSIPTSALGGGVVSSSAQTVAHLENQVINVGAISASGHIVPTENEVYDLGSATKQFRDLYLSGSTIYLGGLKLTEENGGLSVKRTIRINNAIHDDPDAGAAPLSGSFTGSFYGNGTDIVGVQYTKLTQVPANIVSQSSQVILNSTTGTLEVPKGGTGHTTYTNGQLLIGNTESNTLTKATLTAGEGIIVTNGAGTITIAATSTGAVTSVSGTGTVSGLTLSGTVTSSGNLTLGGALSLTTEQVTSALGYTPYNVSNPAGYTTNTGTVTSVATTGTVSGLTLTGGTITTAGTITLGGTLSLTSENVTTALGYTPYNATNPNGYTTNTGTVTSVAGTGTASGLTLSGTVTNSGNLTLSGTVNSLAAGTYAISISGNAATVSGLTLNSSANGINPDNVTQNQIGYNTSVSLFGQTDGGLYSSAYSSSWIHQIFGDFRSGQIAIRGKNNGTWQAWRTVLDSSNYNSYALPLTGGTVTGTTYFRSNKGNGVYSGATNTPPLQAFSDDLGAAFMSFHRGGSFAVNMGLDPDNVLRIGGWSASANRWELDMSGNNWVAGSSRAPIFYDSGNTGYYVDPASVSNINNLLIASAVTNANGGTRNVMPAGGIYTTSASSVSGAIVIKLPVTAFPMIRFTVKVYTYDGLSFDINCGGHTSSGIWYNTFAYMTTATRSALNVRFTYGDGEVYVYIGELGSSWSYPQVFITDVQVGYTSMEYTNWDDGWTITFNASTYKNVSSTHVVYPPMYSSNNTSAAYATIFYDSNNTGYYIDPNTTATSVYVRGEIQNPSVWINDGDNYNNYNENIRLFNAPNGVSVIAFSASGTGGEPTTSILGFSDRHEVRFGSGWQNRIYNGYVEAAGSYRAPIFYDSNNTGYYVDPASTSNLNSVSIITLNGHTLNADNYLGRYGGSYYQVNTWLQFNGPHGIYWPSYYGAHLYANTGSSYTQIRLDGQKNGYDGMWLSYSAVNGMMYDGAGNGGVYREANGRWYFYYHLGNDCMGIGTSSTSSTFSLYLNKGVYAPNRIDATIFYDSANTTYYLDPNNGSYLRGRLEVAGGHGDSTIRVTAIGSELGTGTPSYLQMWVSEPGITWNDGGFGFNVQNDGGSPGGFGRINSGQGQAYMRFTVSGNTIFYNTNTSGTRNVTMEWYPDGTSYANNYLTGGNSLRAPIFYDSNDTTYYVDPASTSVLATINATGNLTITKPNPTIELVGGTGTTTLSLTSYADSSRINFTDSARSIRGEPGEIITIYTQSSLRALVGIYGVGIFNALGVGAQPSGWANGEIRATNAITQYWSDERLKTLLGTIPNALDKLMTLNGYYFVENEVARALGYNNPNRQIGVSAQEIQRVLPEAVAPAPIDEQYLTVRYEKLTVLLIEAVKELKHDNDDLRARIARLEVN